MCIYIHTFASLSDVFEYPCDLSDVKDSPSPVKSIPESDLQVFRFYGIRIYKR